MDESKAENATFSDANRILALWCLIAATAEKLTGEVPVVTLSNRKGDFIEIEGSGGRVKWVKNTDVEAIDLLRDRTGLEEDRIMAAIANPVWTLAPENNWALHVPIAIRDAWENLSLESRVVAYLLAESRIAM